MEQQLLANPEILAQVLQVSNEVKYADNLDTLYFTSCNTIKSIASFHQAFFWQKNYYNKPRIKASSGISIIDKDSPIIIFLQQLIAEQMKQQEKPEIALLDKNYFPQTLITDWNEWLPEHVLWCPLLSPNADKSLIGGLIFTRNYPWTNTEAQVIALACEFIALRLAIFLKKFNTQKSLLKKLSKHSLIYIGLTTLSIILLLPVYQTVLAPAEIIPQDPVIVTSPLNEVVEKFYVKPNDSVKAGDQLFGLDQTELKSNLLIATQEYQELIEKLRSANQFSFENTESNAKLSILKIDAEKAKIKVDYQTELLAESIIKAPSSGIVILGDENDWIGKPVKIGEKVLEIADPNKKRLKILLPVADAIVLKPASKVKVYLNTNPLDVINATLSYASYNAHIQPDSTYSYVLKAEFNQNDKVPRIGLRGTAKIYGEKVTLFYYLMRKPLAALRQKLGI